MRKHCYLVLSVLLSFTSAAWAQRLPIPMPRKFSTPKTIGQPFHFRYTRVSPYAANGRIAGSIEKTELNLRLQRMITLRKKTFLDGQKFSPTKNSTRIDATCEKDTPLRFRGVFLGMLKQGESISMGAAFDARGFQVTTLQSSLPNGTPITVDHLDYALSGYGIQHVLLMIQKKATRKSPKKIRFIDYNLQTRTVKHLTGKRVSH